MKTAGTNRRTEPDRREWDFSALVNCSPNEQRAAWDWEIERERLRHGIKPVAAILGYASPAQIPNAWLSMNIGQRKRETGRIAAGPVWELDHRREARLLIEKIRGHEVPGAHIHSLMICWDGFSLEQVVGELTLLAKKWRMAERRRKRPRDIAPMAWLWNLSCYRLAKAGYDFKQIQLMLNGLPLFKARRSAFSPESAQKSCQAIRAMIKRRGARAPRKV